LFRACQAKLGKTPGQATFFKLASVTRADVFYYWPRYSALAEEAGSLPNEFQSRIPDDHVFRDYARVCWHLLKILRRNELRIVERQRGVRTGRIFRAETIADFEPRFREWVTNSAPDLQLVLTLPGWRAPESQEDDAHELAPSDGILGLHPYLPN